MGSCFGELAPEARGDVVDALLSVLVDEGRHERLRGQVAEAIGEQLEFRPDERVRRVATDLLTNLLNDANATVRFWSAIALGKRSAVSALPALRALAADLSMVTGWWTVGEEATDAIDTIEGRTPPPRHRR